jgi:hypothetical protein
MAKCRMTPEQAEDVLANSRAYQAALRWAEKAYEDHADLPDPPTDAEKFRDRLDAVRRANKASKHTQESLF